MSCYLFLFAIRSFFCVIILYVLLCLRFSSVSLWSVHEQTCQLWCLNSCLSTSLCLFAPFFPTVMFTCHPGIGRSWTGTLPTWSLPTLRPSPPFLSSTGIRYTHVPILKCHNCVIPTIVLHSKDFKVSVTCVFLQVWLGRSCGCVLINDHVHYGTGLTGC